MDAFSKSGPGVQWPNRLLNLMAFVIVGALVMWPMLALAQDVAVPAAGGSPGQVGVEYLLGLGPIGALVYGAWLLGKGVTVKVEVRLDDEDRGLLRRGVEAAESIAQGPTA